MFNFILYAIHYGFINAKQFQTFLKITDTKFITDVNADFDCSKNIIFKASEKSNSLQIKNKHTKELWTENKINLNIHLKLLIKLYEDSVNEQVKYSKY